VRVERVRNREGEWQSPGMGRQPALGFIFITLVLDILGIGLIVPILPKLIENMQGGTLSEGALTYGFLAALYAFMQFLCAPLLGSLSDRFGRRPVILLSLLGGGLDYFLLAFAPDLTWFVIGRIIAGVTGANFAAATAYIADVSPPEKRAANFGLVGAAFGMGFVIGPAIGGWLGHYSFRLPFIVAGCLTLLNWLYGLFVLPESLKPENRRVFSWKRSNPVGALLALRHYPMVLGLSWTFFLINLAHQVFPATWVLYTGYRFDWGPSQVGMSLAFVGVMAAIVQGGLTRKVVPKLGEKRTALLGLTISIFSYIAYGLASQGWMVYAIIVWGSLGGLATPAIQGIVSQQVGADEQGGVQGSLTSLSSVAGILGPPLATGLFAYFVGSQAPFLLPGAAFFCAALIVVIAMLLMKRVFVLSRKSIMAGDCHLLKS